MKLIAFACTVVLGVLAASGTFASPAVALPDCTKRPTPPRCLPDWEPPTAGYEKTYRLQPEWLQVIETEDYGSDEAYIAFSASHRWGPVPVNNGDWVNLAHITDWRFINASQSLALFDLDQGEWFFDPDDQLGTTVIWTSHADGTPRVADFTGHGAHYRLHYRVYDEGCRIIQPGKNECP